MDAYLYLALTIVLLYIQSSSAQESEGYFRKLFGSVARDISCGDVVKCEMAPAISYGCHLYSNEPTRSSESCLVKTFSGKSPTLYVKPGKDFEYLEVIMFHRFCTDSAVFSVTSLGILGEWNLASDLFHDHGGWHEVKVQPQESESKYQLLLNGKEEVGEAQRYISVNKTLIQIMVRGSALWSYDCNPQEYSRDFPLVPWVLFFILASVLVVILVCIIVYCLKKLKKQTRSLADCNSIKISSRSTISLISSPVRLHNQSFNLRGSTNSCNLNWSNNLAGATASGSHNWSSNPAGNSAIGVHNWSHSSQDGCAGQGFQQWSQNPSGDSRVGFHNYAKGTSRNSLAEHVYEDPDEIIYQEIGDFNPVVLTETQTQSVDRRPIIPYTRGNSSSSAFSTANSLYGYR